VSWHVVVAGLACVVGGGSAGSVGAAVPAPSVVAIVGPAGSSRLERVDARTLKPLAGGWSIRIRSQYSVAAGLSPSGRYVAVQLGPRVEEVPVNAQKGPAVIEFGPLVWLTADAEDWSPPAASVVMVTSQDDSGKAICAWNLQRDGRARDLSFPNTTETYTARLQSSG
jgi:hypothetical protein